MKIDSRFIFSVVIIGLVLFFFMRSAGNSVALVMLEGGRDGGGGGGGGGPANGSYVFDSFGPSATIYNGPYNSTTNVVVYSCLSSEISGICTAPPPTLPAGWSCVNTISFTEGSNGGTRYTPHNSYNERTITINLTSWNWDDEGGGQSQIGGGSWQFNWSHTGCSCNLSCSDEVGSNCAGSARGPVAVPFSLTQPLNTNGYAYNTCESGSGYGAWGAFSSNYQATNIACNSGYVIFGDVSNPGSTTSCASPAGTISASQTSCLTGSSCGTITTTINHRWGSVVKLVNVTTGTSTVWQTMPADPTANTSPSSQFSYSQNFTAPATAGQYKFALYNNTGSASLDSAPLASVVVNVNANTIPTLSASFEDTKGQGPKMTTSTTMMAGMSGGGKNIDFYVRNIGPVGSSLYWSCDIDWANVKFNGMPLPLIDAQSKLAGTTCNGGGTLSGGARQF